MTTYLNSSNPPTGFSIGRDPIYDKGILFQSRLAGGEHNTLAGRSMDVNYGARDIPLKFRGLTATQRTNVEAKLNLKTTLYLQLPDSSTVFTGYVSEWTFTPFLLKDGSTYRYDLDFTFKESVSP